MVRIVTVPLDLTAEADRAIAPATVLARQLGAALELVVVTAPGLDRGADEAALQARAAQLTGVPTSVAVSTGDDVVAGLVDLAADPERLVCMASHGRSRLGELLTPSVALALVHTAHRPAVLIGPRLDWWPGPIGTLIVGLDERGIPRTTLDLVAIWASALGADVDLVRAVAPDEPDVGPAGDALDVEAAQTALAERSVVARVRHLLGEPAVTLADAADRAARRSPLVVVTGRVGSRRERVLHGSVTGRLLAANPAPTLVVPTVVRVSRHGGPLEASGAG